MSDRTLRFVIAVVISMLLVYQVGTLITSIFGTAWGVASSVIVAVVSFFAVRLAKAGGKSSFWFLLPTLLFTVVPIVIAVWQALTSEGNWIDRLFSLIPFFVGFGLPIILLVLVYYELRKRALNENRLKET